MSACTLTVTDSGTREALTAMQKTMKEKRSDLRYVKAPIHSRASWALGGSWNTEAKRLKACSRASKNAAATLSMKTIARDIWVDLLPFTTSKERDV